jgi:hypothetical protein
VRLGGRFLAKAFRRAIKAPHSQCGVRYKGAEELHIRLTQQLRDRACRCLTRPIKLEDSGCLLPTPLEHQNDFCRIVGRHFHPRQPESRGESFVVTIQAILECRDELIVNSLNTICNSPGTLDWKMEHIADSFTNHFHGERMTFAQEIKSYIRIAFDYGDPANPVAIAQLDNAVDTDRFWVEAWTVDRLTAKKGIHEKEVCFGIVELYRQKLVGEAESSWQVQKRAQALKPQLLRRAQDGGG